MRMTGAVLCVIVQPPLQFEAGKAGHMDVGDDAARPLVHVRGQKFLRGAVGLRLEPEEAHKAGERQAGEFVVVDDRDLRGRQSRFLIGKG